MNRLIITGATGFVGAMLVQEALAKQYTVTAIVRPGSRNLLRLKTLVSNSLLHLVECDIKQYDSLEIEEPHDCLIHLAWDNAGPEARDDINTQLGNMQGCLAAVRLAKRAGCTVFLGAGSQAEYGVVPYGIKLNGDTPVNPESAYGIAKYSASKLAGLLCAQLGMRYNWVRILSLYGEYDAGHSLIMYTIQTLLKGREPILTKCEQMWDYLYCRDAASAFLAVANKGVDGKAYCLGSGIARPLRWYVEVIRDNFDNRLPLGFGE